VIRIYILFRLPRQKWKNRGDQKLGFAVSRLMQYKNWVASYLTAFYCVGLFLLVLLYLGVARFPALLDIRMQAG
jgi:glycosyltransferase Alg8